LLFFIFYFFGLGLAQPNGDWAGPSQPRSLAQASDLAGQQKAHATRVCVCSEGVIKFKLHSDFVMKNERGGNEKLT